MTTIEQEPLYPQLPVGQEVIFVVSNNTIVATQTNVRFGGMLCTSGPVTIEG